MLVRKRPSITEDSVPSVLFRLSIPMMAVALGIVIFNLTDTFFVGKLGTVPLAALSFTFPVVIFSGSLSMGLGIGTSATVSHALGAKDRTLARHLTTDAHVFAGFLGILVSVVGLLTIDPLFRLLGAENDVLPLIRSYMTIWYYGLPLVIISMTSVQVIQACGDARTPGILMAIAILGNIVLDPILIFGIGPMPRLEIAGAAVATVLARSSSMLFGLYILARRERLFSFSALSPERLSSSGRRIFHIGIPAAAANMMRPLSMGIITRIVAEYGVTAVAGFGVATRLESFALIFVMALSMIITPFTGQNAGARKPKRIRLGIRYATVFSLGWSVIALLVFVFFAAPLAAVFDDSEMVVSIAVRYLLILAASYGFQGTVLVVSAAFNGLHLPWSATMLAFVRLFALYVPFAALGSYFLGLNGVFGGAALANLISGIFGFLWFEHKVESSSLWE